MYARGAGRTALGAALVAVMALVAPGVSQGAATTFSWGDNYFGALGVGQEPQQLELSRLPLEVSLTTVAQVTAGETHALLLNGGGTVESWGGDGHGQLGNGSTSGSDAPEPVPGLAGVKAVAAGAVFSLALLEGGTVDAWGADGEGQLGQGSNSGPETCTGACSTSPIAVPGLVNVRAVAANGNHALALLEDGTVEGWGANADGQVGDGTTAEKDSPVPVAGITEAVAIAAGSQFSLAVLRDGEVRAWGHNNYGQLGNDTPTDSDVPVAVGPLGEAVSVAGGGTHALALLADGEVMAWGNDTFGQLGDGSGGTGQLSSVPVPVSGLSGVSAIAAGGEHSFALTSGGAVKTWGGNEHGQLGDGVDSRSDVPVALACGLTGIQGLASGSASGYAWGPAQEGCPAVTSVSPAEGPAAGETEVTITGVGLGEASQVRFGSDPAMSFSVHSASEIRATAPAGAGTVDVTVSTPHGTSTTSSADRFTYAGKPKVTGLENRSGTASGGTSVTIDGENLGNVTSIDFGSTPAPSFTVSSEHVIYVKSPPGHIGMVDVTVTNSQGTSETTNADRFLYTEAPEFGRCLGGGGDYTNATCSIEGEIKFNYEYYPGFGFTKPLQKRGFTLSSGAITIETVGKRKLSCTGAHGVGEFVAAQSTAIPTLVLTGCSASGLGTCHTAAASEGEVRLAPLAGQLGFATKKTRTSLGGLQVSPSSGETLAEFSCGAHTVSINGAFVGLYGKEDSTTTAMTLTTKDKKGLQEQKGLRAHPEVSIELKLDGGPGEQAGIKLKLAQTNEEAVDINTLQ